jgi:hypothetical protein
MGKVTGIYFPYRSDVLNPNYQLKYPLKKVVDTSGIIK